MVDWNAIAESNMRNRTIQAQAAAQANMASAKESEAKAGLMSQQQEFNRRTGVPGSSAFGMTPSFLSGSTTKQEAEKSPSQGPAVSTDTVRTDAQRAYDMGYRPGVSTSTPPVTSDIASIGSSISDVRTRLGLKKGIARVPGKGDGKKDTVPAKLAPGEAVLNKAAADNMGRGLISALNKMGAKKMGLV